MDFISLLIGNGLSLLAMAANAFSATRKTTRGVLWAQNLAQVAYFSTAMVLRGYSSAAQNAVSFLRNLFAIRGITGKPVEWGMAALGLVLGLAFNNRGLIGLLPVIGNFQYTLAIFRFRDNERALKLSFLASLTTFAVFNLVIGNFVGTVSDMAVVATTAAVLVRERKA